MSDEIVKEFLVESLGTSTGSIATSSSSNSVPQTRTRSAGSFAPSHHQGTCGFLGFHETRSISHVGENLLSKMRDGELLLDEAITAALLAMVDAIRAILAGDRTDRR